MPKAQKKNKKKNRDLHDTDLFIIWELPFSTGALNYSVKLYTGFFNTHSIISGKIQNSSLLYKGDTWVQITHYTFYLTG